MRVCAVARCSSAGREGGKGEQRVAAPGWAEGARAMVAGVKRILLGVVLVIGGGRAARAGELYGEVGLDSGVEEGAGHGGLRLGGVARGQVTSGYDLGTGGEVALGVGALGPLRGSHWLELRYDAARELAAERARRRAESGQEPAPAPESSIESWMIARHRFDFEARAALGRRRDLPAARYTGEHVAMEVVLLGDADPRSGGALMPFTYEVDLVRSPDAEAETATLHRFRASVFRWWTQRAPELPQHVRSVLVIDSQVHDLDRDALADTIVAWAEEGRPLAGPLYLDYRIGFATNTGQTTISDQSFVEQRHPEVTALVADGGLRLLRGPATAALRYDRSLNLSFDSLLVLEDRATARTAWSRGGHALAGEAFAARTLLWSDQDRRRAVTGGGAARWETALRGFEVNGTVEMARSFYARLEGPTEPAWGWRAELLLSRRFGAGSGGGGPNTVIR